MTARPTLILVHGSFHSPLCWDKIIPLLVSEGYKCFAPQLHSSGDDTPVPDIQSDVALLQELIAAETANGRNVVMINHSFGGSPGCSAVKGYTSSDPSAPDKGSGNVIGIVQITALMPMTGVSRNQMVSGGLVPGWHVPGDDGWQKFVGDPAQVFYNDLPADEAAVHVGRLLHFSANAFDSGVGVYSGWADAPVWYLFCTNDQCIPLPTQESLVAIAKERGCNITTRRIDSGHSPFLSKPDETVKFILDAVESFQHGSNS